MTINRFCSSGLQAIALAAERIRAGSAEVIVAGGTESMSMVPMGGNKISPNPWLVDNYPDAYINMGLGTENIARKFGITREQADQFSAESHKKALAAIAAGNFKDETIPVEVKIIALPNGNGASSRPKPGTVKRSEEHTSELQSHLNLVCRLLLEKKKKRNQTYAPHLISTLQLQL